MAGWQFDQARFVEEVLKPVSEGWLPTEDLFRVYQLPDGVKDLSMVEEALAGVKAQLSRPQWQSTWAVPAGMLLAGHEAARALLTDADARARHAAAVRKRRDRLQATVSDRLGEGPGLPKSVVTAVVAASRGAHTRFDLRRVLAELGASEREPVALPPAGQPTGWPQLRQQLASLGKPTLWDYLTSTQGLSGAQVSAAEVAARSGQLKVKRSADNTAETSALKVIEPLVAAGTVRDALRYELYEELGQVTQYRYPDVLEAAKAATKRSAALGLPAKPEDLAFAIWCRRRYAEAGAGPGLQVALKEATDAKDLRKAVGLLAAEEKPTADQKKQLTRLRAELAELDAELARAAELTGPDPERAAELYLAVRGRLADPAIAAGLARCTPAAPTGLTTTRDRGQIVLTWQPTPSRTGRITYTVVRAEGRRPADHLDGTTITSDSPQTRAVDAAAPAAQQLHYAVFAVREGAAVSAPAVSAPATVLPEVADLVVEPASDAVSARWRMPDGAAGVEVTRRPAGSSSAAAAVAGARPTGFTDRSVSADLRYEYQIKVRYRLGDGSTGFSDGTAFESGCQQVPVAVGDLRVRLDGEDLEFSWTPPPAGEVELRELADRRLPEQSVVGAATVPRLGRPLDGVSMRTRNSVRVRPTQGTRQLSVVPVTVLGDLAAVGAPVLVDRRLRPVVDLRAVRRGTEVQLSWVWPDGVSEARLLYTVDRAPTGPSDPTATAREVTRVGYDTLGVRVPVTQGSYTFAVCTVSREGGRETFGPLVTVTQASAREVQYDIGKAGWRARRSRLLLVGSPDGPALPPMLLVAKARTRPMDRTDGSEVLRLDGGATEISQEFEPPPGVARPLHLRLFSLDPGVVLVPRRPDQLVLT